MNWLSGCRWSDGEGGEFRRGWPQSANCGIRGMEVEKESGTEEGNDCRGPGEMFSERGEPSCVCMSGIDSEAAGTVCVGSRQYSVQHEL